jgi:hypothetical protein
MTTHHGIVLVIGPFDHQFPRMFATCSGGTGRAINFVIAGSLVYHVIVTHSHPLDRIVREHGGATSQENQACDEGFHLNIR